MTTKTVVLVGSSYLTANAKLEFAIGFIDTRTGALSAVQPCVTKDHDPNKEMPIAFTLTREEAQVLMDQLWRYGCRPSDEGSPGQLAALRDHLQDMRAIAFAKSRVTKP